MKFAHDFKETLARQEFPEHWISQAIPYSQLKKCLKKVQHELKELGLDPDTLRALLDPNTTSPVALQYKLKTASDSNSIRPKLTVYVHLQDGVAVDASLTPTSRLFLQKIAAELPTEINLSAQAEAQVGHSAASVDEEEVSPEAETQAEPSLSMSAQSGTYETIEVPLVFDGEFFDILQSDVNNLDTLQAEEQEILASEVVELGKEISVVSRPSRLSKNDLARWRQVFELYLDAEIFFATHERDHGARSSKNALNQLQWFQNEVQKRNVVSGFRLNESRQAFARFLSLNAGLLKNLQFQELNKMAVFKILKKFDKRTSLGVSKDFPRALHSHGLLSQSIAKDICAQMSQELVSVVPQLNDYLCPVCFTVAYRPVRLDCQHVFCIRCVIKIQRREEKHCPLCRADVVMNASGDNLDRTLDKYMRKYFSKEVKEKQRANEIERGIEDYGPGYKHHECMIM